MTNKQFPNPYSQQNVVGVQGTPVRRFIVVDIQDPLKTGRIRIREEGHMSDTANIPDDKLPWVKVLSHGSQNQTAGSTHKYLPGSTVYGQGHGAGGQDIVVIGAAGNDRTDSNQSVNPAAHGKGATDLIHTADQFIDKTFAWGVPLSQIVENKTTEYARKIQTQIGRKNNKTAEPVAEARDKQPVPSHYGKRTTSKDPQGGSIGTSMFPGEQNSQQFIKKAIENKSAVVANALDAIEKLKSVKSNVTSIQSIGAGNFQSILQQLSKLFDKGSGSNKKKKYDCEALQQTDPRQLDEDQLEMLAKCQLIEQLKQMDDNNV